MSLSVDGWEQVRLGSGIMGTTGVSDEGCARLVGAWVRLWATR